MRKRFTIAVAGNHDASHIWRHQPSFRQLLITGIVSAPLLAVLNAAIWSGAPADLGAQVVQFVVATVFFWGAILLGEVIHHAVDGRRIRHG